MKIQYASDLHLELSGNSRWIKHHPLAVAGDILILAGDITYLGEQGGVNNPFWDWCSDNFEKTVVVPGNHEYYGGFHLEDTIDHWEYAVRNNVTYANNVCIRFGAVDILFSTLWSYIRSENAFCVEMGVNDYRRIFGSNSLIDFAYINGVYEKSRDYVKSAVESSDAAHIIVVSHHLPSNILVSEKFKGSRLNDAFVSEQGDWIVDSRIENWIYGHSHVNIPGRIGNTTFVSNQLGYVRNEPECFGFLNNAVLIVE